MILSQSSAQPAVTCGSGTVTGTKRIVTSGVPPLAFDSPRSSLEAEPRLLKKNPAEREYASSLLSLRSYSDNAIKRMAGYLRLSTHRPSCDYRKPRFRCSGLLLQ